MIVRKQNEKKQVDEMYLVNNFLFEEVSYFGVTHMLFMTYFSSFQYSGTYANILPLM